MKYKTPSEVIFGTWKLNNEPDEKIMADIDLMYGSDKPLKNVPPPKLKEPDENDHANIDLMYGSDKPLKNVPPLSLKEPDENDHANIDLMYGSDKPLDVPFEQPSDETIANLDLMYGSSKPLNIEKPVQQNRETPTATDGLVPRRSGDRERPNAFLRDIDRMQESYRPTIGGAAADVREFKTEKEKQKRLDETDPLQLHYPKLYDSGAIAQIRAEGYSDPEIIEYFNQREALALSENYLQIEIDDEFGRTPETRRAYQQYITDRQANAYYDALAVNKLGEKRLSFDEVKFRLKAAAILGFNPGLVLDDNIGDALMKRIEPMVRREASFFEAVSDGWERDNISSLITDIVMPARVAARALTKEELAEIERLQRLLPKTPVDNYEWYKFAEGTAGMIRQQLRHYYRGVSSTGGQLLIGAGVISGALLLAASGPIGWGAAAASASGMATLGLASVSSMASLGLAGAMTYGSTLNTFEAYATNAYLEYLQQGVPPDIAARCANVSGLVTVPLNFLNFQRISKYMPGVGSLFKNAGAYTSSALATEAGRAAVKDTLLTFGKDTLQNAFNNAAQDVVIISGGEMAKGIAGISSDVGFADHAERTWDAFMAMIYSAPAGAYGLTKRLYKANKIDNYNNSVIQKSVENLRKLNEAFNSPDDKVIDQTAAVFLPVKDVVEIIGSKAEPGQDKAQFIADSLGVPLTYAQSVLSSGEGEIAVSPAAFEKFVSDQLSVDSDQKNSEGSGVKVTGEEFGKVNLSNKKGKLKFIKSVLKWFSDNLQKSSEDNPILGKIHFTGIGKKELGALNKSLDKLFLVPYLRELIRTSTDVEQNVDLHKDPKFEKLKDRGWKIHYLHNTFERDSKPLSIRLTILEDNAGNKFYALGTPKQINEKVAQPRGAESPSSDEALALNPRNWHATFEQSLADDDLNINIENYSATETAAIENKIDSLPEDSQVNVPIDRSDVARLREVMREGSRGVTAKEYRESFLNKVMVRGQSVLDADTPFGNSARKVQTRMYDYLSNIKGQSVDLAKANARIYAALTAQLAEEAGLMPDAFDALHGIHVEGLPKPGRAANRSSVMLDPDGNVATDRMEGPFEQAVNADVNLDTDEANFINVLKDFDDGKLEANSSIKIMTTPLVFSLAKAEILPITITPEVINKITKGKHAGDLSRSMLEKIPRALTDPIMLFQSTSLTANDSLVAMLEMKNDNGSTVIVSLRLDKSGDAYAVNELTSVYSRETKTNKPQNLYFSTQINNGNLAYINTDKALSWLSESNFDSINEDIIWNAITQNNNDPTLSSPVSETTAYSESSMSNNIPNQYDLVNAKKLHDYKLYQPAGEKSNNGETQTEPRGQIRINPDTGEGFVSLLEKADKSTFVHEMAHWMGFNMKRLAESGHASEAFVNDWNTLSGWLGISDLNAQGFDFSDYVKVRDADGGNIEGTFGQANVSSSQEETASQKLQRETSEFRAVVDKIEADTEKKIRVSTPERMMTTPLALFVAEQAQNEKYNSYPNLQTNEQIREIRITWDVIRKMVDEHGLTYDQVRELPSKLADPLLVLEPAPDSQIYKKDINAKGLVAVVEMKNQDGTNIMVPVLLEAKLGRGQNAYDVNIITSGYGRSSGNKWYVSEAQSGRLLYADMKRASTWSRDAGLQLPRPATLRKLNPNIKTFDDLVNARNDYFGYFQPASEESDSRGQVRTNSDTGWTFARKDGAEITAAEIENAARWENAQELLARSFETYLMEGKAPSSALGKIFSKFKNWLKRIYKELHALNAPINDEVRGVFARLLASPEEISAKQEMDVTIGQLAADYAAREQLIQDLINAGVMNESAWRAYHEGSSDGYQEAKAQYETLRKKQQNEAERRQEIRNITRMVRGALRDNTIDSYKRDDISRFIEGYELKRKTKNEMEIIAEIDSYFADPEEQAAELEGFPREKPQYLRKELLQKMTLPDLQTLKGHVEYLVREGREIFRQREAAFREQLDNLAFEALKAIPEKPKTKKDMKLITGHKDISKESSKVGKAYSKLLTPMRLVDWVEGGSGKFDGPLSRVFTWAINKAKDTELKHRTQRIDHIQQVMRENGVSIADLARSRVIDTTGIYNGDSIVPMQEMKLDHMLSIAVALRNKKAMAAVFFGNFRELFSNLSGAELEKAQMQFAGRVFSNLSVKEINVANAIVEDGDINFSRIDAAMRSLYNQGMKKEENYMTMRRLSFNSEQGMIDAADANNWEKAAVSAGKMAKAEKGFTQSRFDVDNILAIDDAGIRTRILGAIEQPIQLGLYETFIDNAANQEHLAAAGETIKLMKALLTWKDQNGKQLLKDRIVDKFGSDVWRELTGYYNTVMLNEADIVRSSMDGFVGKTINGFAATYLAYNFITPFKQFSALPRFLGLAGPGNMLKAVTEALINPNTFMEQLDADAPQLKDRMNEFNTRNMSELARMNLSEGNWLTNKLNKWNISGMQGISYLDKLVAAVGYRAVYLTETGKGASHADAARAAQQSVLLTQQAQHAKDLPRLLRLGGAWRLMNMFATQMSARANILLYDMPAALRQKEFTKFLGLAAGQAMELFIIGLLTKGTPDFDKDEDWAEWGGKLFTREFLNTVPLIGKELAAWNDGFSGQWGTLSAPIINALNSSSRIFDDKKDFRPTEDSLNLLDALSIYSPWHLPVTGLRRLFRFGEDALEDDYNRGLLRLFGMSAKKRQ